MAFLQTERLLINSVNPYNANTIGLMRRLGFEIVQNHAPRNLVDFGEAGVQGILVNPAAVM